MSVCVCWAVDMSKMVTQVMCCLRVWGKIIFISQWGRMLYHRVEKSLAYFNRFPNEMKKKKRSVGNCEARKRSSQNIHLTTCKITFEIYCTQCVLLRVWNMTHRASFCFGTHNTQRLYCVDVLPLIQMMNRKKDKWKQQNDGLLCHGMDIAIATK